MESEEETKEKEQTNKAVQAFLLNSLIPQSLVLSMSISFNSL